MTEQNQEGPKVVPPQGVGGIDSLAEQIAMSRAGAVNQEESASSDTQAQPQESPPVEQPQEPEQAQTPESLTGQETPEELNQLGYGTDASNRIRKLARERNDAHEKSQKLEQETHQWRSWYEQNGAQQQAQQVQQATSNFGQKPAMESFDEPFPEEGELEQQESWKIRKEAHGIAQKETMKAMQAVANLVGPMFAQNAQVQRESEWGGIAPELTRFGTSREEIEPLVTEMLRQQPTREMRGAAYDAMAMIGALSSDAAATPPAVATPGSGRTAPAATPPPAPSRADRVTGLLSKMKEQGGKGRHSDSLNTLAELFSVSRHQTD